ncbi:MAG TPA: Flp family type IVb pilin [Kineosporiaceae bacterium]
MFAYLRKVTRRDLDRGASAVEYGLMVAAIAAVIVGAVFVLGNMVKDKFTETTTCIATQNGAPCASTSPAP